MVVVRNPSTDEPEFSVDVWAAATDCITRLPFRFPRRPISAEHDRAIRADFADRMARMFEKPVADRIARDSLRLPPHWPAVDHVFVGDDGRIFLRHPLSISQARWTIIDTTGQLIGRLETPATLAIRWAHGQRGVAVRKDALGVETVGVYDLTPGLVGR